MKRNFAMILMISASVIFASCSSEGEDSSSLLMLGLGEGSSLEKEDNGEKPGDTENNDGSESSDPTVSGDLDEEQINVEEEDTAVDEEEAFTFQTSREVDLNVAIQDQSGSVEGALVKVIDNSSGSELTLFQGRTGESGEVSGGFTVEDALETVLVRVVMGDTIYEREVTVTDIASISRSFTVEGSVDTGAGAVADSDGDGIPDNEDAYPEDSTASAIVTTPSIGNATVAFEDLYPRKGDADFNDFVTTVHMEEDLNADGKVVRLRGEFQLIGKGAGYDHDLMLNIPGNRSADVVVERFTPEGDYLEQDHYPSTSGIKLINSSKRSISGKNTRHNETFSAGNIAKVSVEFDSPVSKKEIGKAPYDLHLYVRSTKREIHFPGFYTDEAGKDLYIDEDGFPWAIMVPQEWNWPLESRRIGDFHAKAPGCYPEFDTWYKSEGKQAKDWYETYDEDCVFPYTESVSEQTGLSGFLGSAAVSLPLIGLTALLGVAGLLAATALKNKAQ